MMMIIFGMYRPTIFADVAQNSAWGAARTVLVLAPVAVPWLVPTEACGPCMSWAASEELCGDRLCCIADVR